MYRAIENGSEKKHATQIYKARTLNLPVCIDDPVPLQTLDHPVAASFPMNLDQG